MRRDVENFVAAFLLCQQTKYSTQAPVGLLQPLQIPDKLWDEITMDFIVGLPLSYGYTVMMVVVDRLTKYAHFGALSSNFNASWAAKLFIEIVVRHHSYPSVIISDRDPIFLSHFWENFFKLSGMKLKHSTANHPQTDGQTEVVNRGLEQYLWFFLKTNRRLVINM